MGISMGKYDFKKKSEEIRYVEDFIKRFPNHKNIEAAKADLKRLKGE